MAVQHEQAVPQLRRIVTDSICTQSWHICIKLNKEVYTKIQDTIGDEIYQRVEKINFDWRNKHHLNLKPSDSSGGDPTEKYVVTTLIFHECDLDELPHEDYDHFKRVIKEGIVYSIRQHFKEADQVDVRDPEYSLVMKGQMRVHVDRF